MARALVIDDDAQVRQVLRRMLERAGHEVHAVSDGMGAAGLYREHPSDLVITDIYMPEKAGLETILELRTEFPDVKIIAMSGGEGIFDLQPLGTAKRLGVVGTLQKPFRWEDLKAAIEKAFAD